MMPNLHRSHYLSFKLFFAPREVIFDLFYRHFSAPPLPLKHFWRVTIPNFLLEDQSAKVNYVLFCIFSNFFNHKLFQIDDILLFLLRKRLFGHPTFSLNRLRRAFFLFILNLMRSIQRNQIFMIWLIWSVPFFLTHTNRSFLLFRGSFDQRFTLLETLLRLFLSLFFVKEKVHQLNFVYVCLIGRIENLFWSIRFNFHLSFGAFLEFLLFFKLFFDNAEKLTKLIIFLILSHCVDREKIFV